MQIAQIIRQCFDILDTYGKSPEALENLALAMIEDLQNYSVEEISSAFREWRRTKTKLPVPADILSILRENRQPKREYYVCPPEQAEKMRLQSEKNRVTWGRKTWAQMDEREKNELRQRLREDQQNKGDFWKYVKRHKEMPAEEINQFVKYA